MISDPRYDFYKPQIDATGQLYFLKRPYKNQSYSGVHLKIFYTHLLKLFVL
jgi:hypothetical protein